MKKLLITLIAFALAVLPLSGCRQASSQQSASAASAEAKTPKKIRVVTTIFPQYDFTRNIAGDKADVTLLLPPGAESHTYEPTPQDMITIQNCDLFIYVGGESDVWIDTIVKSMGDKAPRTLALMDCVEAVTEEIVEGMQVDHDHDDDADHGHDEDADHHLDEEIVYDEHVWTSPKNAVRIVRGISNALGTIDGDNADTYTRNAEVYIQKLNALDSALSVVCTTAARKTLIMGDRFPFRYLADAYGLRYYAAFPGCSGETEASAATVAFLIDKIKAEQIPVICHIEFSNRRVANAIAEATGAEPMLLHSVHNLSKQEIASGASYLSIMQQNIETLRKALN